MTLSSNKFNLHDILGRIKAIKDIKTDIELAKTLGMGRTTLAERKRRGSLPYDELIRFSFREGVSLDWLLTGEGAQHREKPVIEKEEKGVSKLLKPGNHPYPTGTKSFGYKLKQPPPPKYGTSNPELEQLVNQLYRVYLLGDENAKSKLRILLAALDPGEP